MDNIPCACGNSEHVAHVEPIVDSNWYGPKGAKIQLLFSFGTLPSQKSEFALTKKDALKLAMKIIEEAAR